MTKVMAKTSAATEHGGGAVRAKLPIPMLLLVVIFGVWIGLAAGGAVAFYLAKSGKLPQVHAGESMAATGVSHPMVLEPILVNLADEGGHAYLRVGLTLEVSREAGAAEAGQTQGAPEKAIRDIVLTVLGRQTSASLLGPDGKEHLKIELREAVTKSNLRLVVKDLYFSDFLVQS